MPEPDDDRWLLDQQRAIGDRIRAARMHANLTQEQVYLAAGISRNTLQGAESGHGNPRLSTLLRISRVLGVPLNELLP